MPGLGLVVHQCLVDCARAALLFPLGWSLLTCQHVTPKCSLIETAFLCLATVSAVSVTLLIMRNTRKALESGWCPKTGRG